METDMTDAQLYLAIGLPSLVVMSGILVNGLLIQQLGNQLSARITSLETSLNSRISSLETRFETLTGKVIEIDNRLTRLEERLEHRR
jgi:hypothetical protein